MSFFSLRHKRQKWASGELAEAVVVDVGSAAVFVGDLRNGRINCASQSTKCSIWYPLYAVVCVPSTAPDTNRDLCSSAPY